MNLCFIGGGNPLAGELDDVMDYLKNYIGIQSKILIIPFATEDSKLDRWFHSAKKSFEDIGVKHISLLNSESTNQEMQDAFKSHHVLYFTGGRPEMLIDKLKEKDLVQTIKEHTGILIGVSAGALAFCSDCIITKDEDYPETLILKGLGLVDFSVEVHYDEMIDEELIPLSFNRDIYAIPNGSALYWDGEVVIPVNSVFHIQRGSKVKLG